VRHRVLGIKGSSKTVVRKSDSGQHLPTLLYTRLGIEKTLGFLRETRIATRRWHVERRSEEEGGGGVDGEVEEEVAGE